MPQAHVRLLKQIPAPPNGRHPYLHPVWPCPPQLVPPPGGVLQFQRVLRGKGLNAPLLLFRQPTHVHTPPHKVQQWNILCWVIMTLQLQTLVTLYTEHRQRLCHRTSYDFLIASKAPARGR